MHEEFERQVHARPHDRELRLVHADWLEENGFADRASYLRGLVELTTLLDRGAARDALEERSLRLAALVRDFDPGFAAVAARGADRWGGALAFAPVRLEVEAEAADHRLRWTFEPQLRSTILVVGDFTGRPDARVLEDRREIGVSRETFERRLQESKLRFTIDGAGRALELGVDRLSDFEPDAIAGRIAAATALSGSELERVVSSVFRQGPFLQAERAWRSLWTLLQHTPTDVHVAFVTASKEDLVADFDDAPEIAKSGLFRLVNSYNHHGMRPYAMLVLDHDIDPASASDRTLLAQLGEVGQRSVLPILTGLAPDACGAAPPPEHPAHAKWRSGQQAFYVALCAPSFELRRSSHGTLRGAVSFLAACLAAQSCSRQLCGSPLLGSIPATALASAIDLELARDRGYLAFATTEAGASLGVDATCVFDSDGARRSLSAAFLVTRMCHQILDIDNRALPERDVGRLTARFNEMLAARFASIPGVTVTTSEIEWIGDPRLRATVTLTVPSAVSPQGTTLRVPVLLRMDR